MDTVLRLLNEFSPMLNSFINDIEKELVIPTNRKIFSISDIVVDAKNNGDIFIELYFRSNVTPYSVQLNAVRLVYKGFGTEKPYIDAGNVQVKGMLSSTDMINKMRYLVRERKISANGLAQNYLNYMGVYLEELGILTKSMEFVNLLVDILEKVGVYDICKLWISRVSDEEKHIVGYQNKSVPFKEGIKNAIVLEVR